MLKEMYISFFYILKNLSKYGLIYKIINTLTCFYEFKKRIHFKTHIKIS